MKQEPCRQRGFTMIELMVIVAILGIIAAAAIPTYMKYIRRSKTTEASLNVRKLFDASVMYFAADHASSSGAVVPKMFPVESPGTGISELTPAVTCCVRPGGKCVPDPNYWQTPTWNALHFAVDDPFYFLYKYYSGGTDFQSSFQAAAHGDFTCDGVYSTFERLGSIDINFDVIGSAGLYINKELE